MAALHTEQGMGKGKNQRVKRRLLQEAVADNLATIRGLPPRPLMRKRRLGRLWLKRISMVAVPLMLASSSYVVSTTTASLPAARPILLQAAMQPPRLASRRVAGTATLDATTALQRFDTSVFPLSVRRIVLDAGHGGNDPGASSATLLSEKDVTLDIEHRLHKLLAAGGFEVITTRPDDRFIPLRDRAKVANSSDSDIFVSIHVNSVRNPISHGVETYYLGATNDPALTRLAADENRASGYSLSDMRKLLDGIYADARRDESHRLADSIQKQLYGGLRDADPGLQNWGVKRAPFIVLVATEMPAILAEVGCLSNDAEALKLRQPEYRQKIANALFEGIKVYATQTKG
jgi:N-acetylmuramoyl-L-alanine amidase